MKDQFLSHDERSRRVEATLKTLGWSWYKLAQEMGVDQMTVSRHLKWRGRADIINDPKLSLLKALARATCTTVGFWVDRRETK